MLKFITDQEVIRRIVTHLGKRTELPLVAPARSSPRVDLPFE